MQKEITVLGRTFEVRQKTNAQMASINRKLNGKNFAPDGLLKYDARIIYIRSENSAREKRLTLYHEVCHIALRVSGASQSLSGDIEEVICETMANSFADIIKS